MNARTLGDRGTEKDKSMRSFLGSRLRDASVFECAAVFLEYVFFFALVVLTGGIWPRQEGFDLGLNALRVISFLLPLIIALLRQRKRPAKHAAGLALWVGVLFIALLLSLWTPGAKLNPTILMFAALICFSPYAFSFHTREELCASLNRFVQVVVLVAIVSLVFFFAGSIFHLIRPTGRVVFEWDWERSVDTYFNLYYEPQITYMMGYNGVRNCGIFAEAPMFVYLLLIAITLKKTILNSSRLTSFVLIVTVVTTLSTTGIAALALLYAFLMLTRPAKTIPGKKMKFIIGPLVLLAGVLVVLFFLDDKSETGSYSVRSDHLLACMQIFFDTFPFGCGLGNTDFIFRFTDYDQGIAVGLPYLFAETGLVGILLVFGPICFALLKAESDVRQKLMLIAIIYVWLFASTNIQFNSMVEWLVLEMVFLCYPMLGSSRATRGDGGQQSEGAMLDGAVAVRPAQ